MELCLAKLKKIPPSQYGETRSKMDDKFTEKCEKLVEEGVKFTKFLHYPTKAEKNGTDYPLDTIINDLKKTQLELDEKLEFLINEGERKKKESFARAAQEELERKQRIQSQKPVVPKIVQDKYKRNFVTKKYKKCNPNDIDPQCIPYDQLAQPDFTNNRSVSCRKDGDELASPKCDLKSNMIYTFVNTGGKSLRKKRRNRKTKKYNIKK